MSKTAHRLYLGTMACIVIAVTIYLIMIGNSYYQTPLEERFYHSEHKALKPSGLVGQGLGIIGTLLILIGVFGYQARKYLKALSKIWVLKHWLEFHIFLCTLGPILVLFHTSFKFGGIVSISFWSMVAVVASGVIGRFIYLQIPRTINGRELSLGEIKEMKAQIADKLNAEAKDAIRNNVAELTALPQSSSNLLMQFWTDWQYLQTLKKQLISLGLSNQKTANVLDLVKQELNTNRKIERLAAMQKMFKYWHVIHTPFAIIMLVIMVIHVGVSIALGYRWIF
ncbi:MAG: hypothetical protein U0Y10_21620 [Spirosomataceae bacterium]